jgi:hypothetical protein
MIHILIYSHIPHVASFTYITRPRYWQSVHASSPTGLLRHHQHYATSAQIILGMNESRM